MNRICKEVEGLFAIVKVPHTIWQVSRNKTTVPSALCRFGPYKTLATYAKSTQNHFLQIHFSFREITHVTAEGARIYIL